MKEKKGNGIKLISNKRLLISASILVFSIVVIGFSLTYAYFSVGYGGKAEVNGNQAAILNVDSDLKNASAINETEMALINQEDVENEAKKVTFDVINQGSSTVNAKYIVKLIDYSITKNLSSKYFKWKLVVNPGESEQVFTGNFLQSPEDEGTKLTGDDTDNLTGLNKVLIDEDEAITLNIGKTDHLVFYVWIENDSALNQIYLTNGEFRGRLSLEAFPTK